LALQANAHLPSVQLAALALAGTGHGVRVWLSPSGSHTRRSLGPEQSALPGVHVHPVHRPIEHDSTPPQLTSRVLKPSSAHTRTVRAS
jgi:hypothetical protein